MKNYNYLMKKITTNHENNDSEAKGSSCPWEVLLKLTKSLMLASDKQDRDNILFILKKMSYFTPRQFRNGERVY